MLLTPPLVGTARAQIAVFPSQTQTLETCLQAYCMVGILGLRKPQCMLPPYDPQVLLPGVCVIEAFFNGCHIWQWYGDNCSAIASGSLQLSGAASASLNTCLIENCFKDGKGQCDGSAEDKVLPGACILLAREVSGTMHTLTPGCEQFVDTSRSCAYVEKVRAEANAEEDGGCSAAPTPGRSGRSGLPLLAVVAGALALLATRRRARSDESMEVDGEFVEPEA